MNIPFRDRFRMVLRSLTLQGSWNFPQMQGLGFFFMLVPWLRKTTGARFQEACRRHFGYFNTHPYMASYIVGVVARLEEQGMGEESLKAKKDLMGPLGAVGDGLFWAKLRPAAILLVVTATLYRPWLGAPLLLLIYNIPHLRERWNGIGTGYHKAETPIKGITDRKKGWFSRYSQHLIMGMCGFLVGAASFRTGSPGPVFLLFLLGFLLFSRKSGALLVLGCLLTVGLILGLLGIRMELPWSI